MAIIPFQDWTPDIAPLGSDGMTVCKNCLPLMKGYGPFPSFAPYTAAALSARVIGAFSAKDKSGNTYNYAATVGSTNAGKLNLLTSGTWTDASGNGGDATPGYAIPDGEVVEFVKWNESVLAATIGEPLQKIDFGGTNFGNCITSTRKPRARHIGILRNFVVLGNIDDVSNDGIVPNRVWWSGIEDETTFEEGGESTQSDFQDLKNGGAVQAVISGEVGMILCETSIHRMTQLGFSPWFSFDEVVTSRGVWIPNSVATSGGLTFFLDRDGWYVWDGQSVTAIGINKFDVFFRKDFDPNYMHRASAAIDPIRKLYLFAYASFDATAGTPNRILAYDWVNKKGTITELTLDWLYQFRSEGQTVDTITAFIDDLMLLVDDPAFIGKNLALGAFSADHQLSSLTGEALSAVFETGEKQLSGPGGMMTQVNMARPLIDGAQNVTVTPYTRYLQANDAVAGAGSVMNSLGNCNMRSTGRFHRFRAATTGNFATALGIDVVEAVPAGMR